MRARRPDARAETGRQGRGARERRAVSRPRSRRMIVRAAGSSHGKRVRQERARSQNLMDLERIQGCRRDSRTASGSELEAGSTPAPFTGRCSTSHRTRSAPPDAASWPPGSTPPIARQMAAGWGASSSASRPGDPTPDRGLASFRALLRDTRKKGADFGLPVPAVTAKRPD
jgi:hypothetical protein